MSISNQDFYRLLPFALKGHEYKISNNQINIKYGDGNIQIKPGIEHERKIASLILPVLHVVFIFTNISSGDIDEFFAIFNQAYHRGGG